MAWTTPLTAVSNAALTAAQWNASVRDDLAETAPAKATAAGQIFVSTAANAIAARVPTHSTVATTELTASTTYIALTTAGPAVTVTTGTQAVVFLSTGMTQSLGGGFCNCSFAVSGATTIAAGAQNAGIVSYRPSATGTQTTQGVTWLQTGLTGGSNTFTMLYNAGAGGGNASFFQRELVVIPL